MRRRGDPGTKSAERLLLVPKAGRVPVPQLDHPVAARRGQTPAVAAEHQPPDGPVVRAELAALPPARVSQTCTVPFALPVTRYSPSRLNATA